MSVRGLRVGVCSTSLAVLVGLSFPAGASAVRSVSSTPPSARVDQTLVAVSADSASDAWAVGSRDRGAAARHWDGTSWTSVPVQNPSRGATVLDGVDALSPSDVWAVGQGSASRQGEGALIEHWDGSSFTIVPSPDPGGDSSALQGVSAVSPSDVWAVGGVQDSGVEKSLIEHWDGTTWSVVPPPKNAGLAALRAVTALSSDDVWAAGAGVDHWNGQRWTVVKTPDVGYVASLSAVSSTDLWGVGSDFEPGGIMLHWDGDAWTENWTVYDEPLAGVAAVAANDVWAVGSYSNTGLRGWAFFDHWDGSSWTQVKSQRIGQNDQLAGVSAVSSSDVWAVGHIDGHGGVQRDLIEHWDGTQWTAYPVGT